MKRPIGIDSAVVDTLEGLGSDLNKEREIEFFLYFSEEYEAYTVATELSNMRFKTSVSYSEPGDKWLCFATKSMKATTERLTELGDWMEKLAEQHNGRYDGWGTLVVPGGN